MTPQKEKPFEESFDKFAQIYDEVRPGYPKQLFEDIRDVCKAQELSNILEIGTGTGIATKSLTNFNLPITTIEPGENLLNITKINLESDQNIIFINSTFEKFKTTEKYDMLFSATAFHWLDKEIKYKKANRILSDKGFLVLIWNNFFRDDSIVYQKTDTLYQKYLPAIDGQSDANIRSLNKLIEREVEISESNLFYITFSQKYITNYVYTGENYARLLNTFPEIIKLEQSKRNSFLSEIRETVDKHKIIHIPVMSSLYICRKKESFSKIISSYM